LPRPHGDVTGWGERMMSERMTGDTGVRVVNDAHLFAVQMDVSDYKPGEMDVKVHDENKDTGYLVVTGKHEEKPDEHGFVSRSFTRRYALPKDVDMSALQCNLSNKGILTLQVPRKPFEMVANKTRAIHITHVADAPMLAASKATANK